MQIVIVARSFIENVIPMDQTSSCRLTITTISVALITIIIVLGGCTPVGEIPPQPADAVSATETQVSGRLTVSESKSQDTYTSLPSPSATSPATSTTSPSPGATSPAISTTSPNPSANLPPQEEPDVLAFEWDVIVLGLIDANWLSQHGPSPHVSYTQVLTENVPVGHAQGQLAILEVAEHLLPDNETPVYQSQQPEIIFLKKVVVAGYENVDVYKVMDVMEANPENIALFLDQ